MPGSGTEGGRTSFMSSRSKVSLDYARASTDRPESRLSGAFRSSRPSASFQPLDGSQPRLSFVASGAPTSLTFKSTDLRSALHLHAAHTQKQYMEGYLLVRHALAVDGQPDHRSDHFGTWTECYVQLRGTVLSMWDARALDEAATSGREVPPTFVNVTDALVDYIGMHVDATLADPGRRMTLHHTFSLSSAGSNQILFAMGVPPPCEPSKVEQRLSAKAEHHPEHRPVVEWYQLGQRYLQAWINAIRLASWERARLDEVYTGALIRARLGAVKGVEGQQIDELVVRSPLVRGHQEGWVRARFMGSTKWRRCWLVLRSHWSEEEVSSNGLKRLLRLGGDRAARLGATSSPMLEPPAATPGSRPSQAVALFYESKRSRQPLATLWHVRHTYAVYPSRPDLVEDAVLFKAEGVMPQSPLVSATHRPRVSGWVMFMPDTPPLPTRGVSAEMLRWVIAFMDVFGLYGRPEQFSWNPRDPSSLFFAYPIGPHQDHLFLDRTLVEALDMTTEDHLTTRQAIHDIMAARMRGHSTPMLPPLPPVPRRSSSRADPASGREPLGAEAAVVPPTAAAPDGATMPPPPAANETATEPAAPGAAPTDVPRGDGDEVPAHAAQYAPEDVATSSQREARRATMTAGDFQALLPSFGEPHAAASLVGPDSHDTHDAAAWAQEAHAAVHAESPAAAAPTPGAEGSAAAPTTHAEAPTTTYAEVPAAALTPSVTVTEAPAVPGAGARAVRASSAFDEAYSEYSESTPNLAASPDPGTGAAASTSRSTTAHASDIYDAYAWAPAPTSAGVQTPAQDAMAEPARMPAAPTATAPAEPPAPAPALSSASAAGTSAPLSAVAAADLPAVYNPRHDRIYAWPVPDAAHEAPAAADESVVSTTRAESRPLPTPPSVVPRSDPAAAADAAAAPPPSSQSSRRSLYGIPAYGPDAFASSKPPIQVRVVPGGAARSASGSRPLPVPTARRTPEEGPPRAPALLRDEARVPSGPAAPAPVVTAAPAEPSSPASVASPALPSSLSFLAPSVATTPVSAGASEALAPTPSSQAAAAPPPTAPPPSQRVVSGGTDHSTESRVLENYLGDPDDDDDAPVPTTRYAQVTASMVTPLRMSPTEPSPQPAAADPSVSFDWFPDAHDEDGYGSPEAHDARGAGAPPTATAVQDTPSASASSGAYPSTFGRRGQARLSTTLTSVTEVQARPPLTSRTSARRESDDSDTDEPPAGGAEAAPPPPATRAPRASGQRLSTSSTMPALAFGAGSTTTATSPDTSWSQSQTSTAPAGSRMSTSTSLSAVRPTNGTPSTSAPSARGKSASQPRATFVKLPQDLPATSPYAPHGLLASASQERLARSPAGEREHNGAALLQVPSKPPPPQAGLMGAIHSRDRRVPLGERDMRSRPTSMASTSRSLPASMPASQTHLSQQHMMMNMYYWQQQQMMMMMGMLPPPSREAMAAQQQAMQAAQQAYYQTYAQHASATPELGMPASGAASSKRSSTQWPPPRAASADAVGALGSSRMEARGRDGARAAR